jgi:hypothetical protein
VIRAPLLTLIRKLKRDGYSFELSILVCVGTQLPFWSVYHVVVLFNIQKDTPMARNPSWRQGRAFTAEGTCLCVCFSFCSTHTLNLVDEEVVLVRSPSHPHKLYLRALPARSASVVFKA